METVFESSDRIRTFRDIPIDLDTSLLSPSSLHSVSDEGCLVFLYLPVKHRTYVSISFILC